ncbi:MAG: hypothetical protein M9962_13855 [Oligoflexia bacterium]|nr:hypothetical protein [Oligoflexia bacterium]
MRMNSNKKSSILKNSIAIFIFFIFLFTLNINCYGACEGSSCRDNPVQLPRDEERIDKNQSLQKLEKTDQTISNIETTPVTKAQATVNLSESDDAVSFSSLYLIITVIGIIVIVLVGVKMF